MQKAEKKARLITMSNQYMFRISNQKLIVIAVAILAVSLLLCVSSFIFKKHTNSTNGLAYTLLLESPQTAKLTEIISGTLVDIEHSTSGGLTTVKVVLSNSTAAEYSVVLPDFDAGYNTVATRICKLDFCFPYGTVGFDESAWSSATTSELQSGDEVILVKSELSNAKVNNIYQLYISR